MGCGAGKMKGGSPEGTTTVPHFKFVLVGDAGVGKTSVFLRYSRNQFDYNYKPTLRVSIENVVRKLNLPNDAIVSVTLWDIPGSDDLDLRHTYFQNVDALLVVVDVNDVDSIEMASTWRQDFLAKASQTNTSTESATESKSFDPRKVPMLLLGNKYDLVEDKVKESQLKDDLTDSAGMQNRNELDSETDEKVLEEETLKVVEVSIEDRHTSNQLKDGKEMLTSSVPDSKIPCPKCVEMLENMATRYGFIGSIVVSAKYNDWSVHAAVQSLVRHLLDKKGTKPLKKHKIEEVKELKQKVKHDHKKANLQQVGVPQLDAIWERAQVPYQKLHDYLTYHALVERRFRQACADQGLLTSSQATLEDCIIALRSALHDGVGASLKAHEDEGFVELTYKVEEGVRMPMSLAAILAIFHDEFAATCKAMLRDLPSLDILLEKFEAKIIQKMHLYSTSTENKQGNGTTGNSQDDDLNNAQKKQVQLLCDQNQALVTHLRQLGSRKQQAIVQAKHKIEGALLW